MSDASIDVLVQVFLYSILSIEHAFWIEHIFGVIDGPVLF